MSTIKKKATPKKKTVTAKHRATEQVARVKSHVSVSKCRERIKALDLLIMLQENSLNARKKPLHANKLAAIKMLLDRAVPVLRSVEIKAQVDGQITISWED